MLRDTDQSGASEPSAAVPSAATVALMPLLIYLLCTTHCAACDVLLAFDSNCVFIYLYFWRIARYWS